MFISPTGLTTDSMAVFDLPNPNPYSDQIQWIRPIGQIEYGYMTGYRAAWNLNAD